MKLHFFEKQYFRNVWILIFFILINGLFLYGIFNQVILGKSWGTVPAPNLVLFIIEGFCLVFFIWFWNIKLIVKVQDKGIYIKFFMMCFKFKVIDFDQIETCKVREYNAIKEFGGWGIKGRKHNKAYTISGKDGVQIRLKNEKKVLIGSQKSNGLAQAIKKNLKKN